MKTRNRKVLITGATSGIGRALTQRFLRDNYTVIAVGRTLSKLDDLSQEKLILKACDLSQMQEVEALIHWVKVNHADLEILINNAGIQHNYHLLQAENRDHRIEEEISINLLAPIYLCTGLLSLMASDDSAKAIVNVTSGLADVPKASAPVYCATKAALKQFSKTMKWQLERGNISVFDLSPSLVDTEMTAGRGKGKITPEQLVDEFWPKFRHGQYHIDIGKVKWLKRINRISPAIAESIMKNA